MRIAVLSLVPLLAGLLPAQATWTLRTPPPTVPDPRASAFSAVDTLGLFVFGGFDAANTFRNDLWRFDGTAWTNLVPQGAPGSPTARRWGAAAYDHGRGRFVIFGGYNAANVRLGDTWEWDGTQWLQATPAAAPSARRWARMAYDWTSSRLILFGGETATGYLGDTWAWDGTNWTQLSPATSPPARGRHQMAERMLPAEILLSCGTNRPTPFTPPLSDTWRWDGSNWTQVTTSGAPYTTGVLEAGFAFDTLRGAYVLFGGFTGTERNQTWELHGTTWTQRVPAPAPGVRSGPAMGFPLALGKTLLFGGFTGAGMTNQTWDYQTTAPAAVAVYGAGCAGSAGVPALTTVDLPWTADVFDLDVQNVPAAGAALVVLGYSNTSYNGIPLPLPLAGAGAPGCSLLASMQLIGLASGTGGTARWSLPVPNDPTLSGATFYSQALVLDLPANLLGLTTSNGISGIVGLR